MGLGWVMVGSTYERYKSALERIADGVDDPQAVAKKALESRKGEPTYKWKREAEARKERAEAKRQARREFCALLYRDWLDAGQPTVAAFARSKGKSRTSTEMALKQYERRELPYDKRVLQNAEWERGRKLSEAKLRKNKDHWVRVRYFDREEPAETIAADVGWTMETMREFIAESRRDKWVTTTEYNKHWEELRKKYRHRE